MLDQVGFICERDWFYTLDHENLISRSALHIKHTTEQAHMFKEPEYGGSGSNASGSEHTVKHASEGDI